MISVYLLLDFVWGYEEEFLVELGRMYKDNAM